MNTDLDDKIARLERELAEARKAKANSLSDPIARSPEGQLAIYLHETFCPINHTDGCDWQYDVAEGVHNWNGHAHKRYLHEAKDLRAFINTLPRIR